MAKKKKKNRADGGDLASEEILDSLAKGDEDGAEADAEASEDEAEATVEASSAPDEAETSEDSAEEPVVPTASGAREKGSLSAEFLAWPCDKDHDSAASFLRGEGAGDASKVVLDEEDELGSKGGGLNFVLMLLVIAAGVVGVWQFRAVSSPEALAAKKAEREAIEEAHLAEQMAKQKKYGVLRIESNPPQATVLKDGEKIVTKSEATGEEIVGKTPMNLMDLDIAVPVKIRLEAEGYEPFEFNVAEHLWTKDAGSGEYKFFKLVEMTPNVCEYWFLYDAKKKREMQFKDDLKEGGENGKSKCGTYYDEAVKGGTSVTECTCKIPPEGWEPPSKDKKKKK